MALTKLKMAVFAPMPSASVSTATAVKPGFFSSWRKAKRRSFMAQGGHGLGEQERSKTNESRGDCSVHEQYSSICHSSLEMVPTERLALSRGNGRQFTKLPLSLLKPHRRNGGPPRICTVFHPGKSRG